MSDDRLRWAVCPASIEATLDAERELRPAPVTLGGLPGLH